MLKRIFTYDHPYEVDIILSLVTEELVSDPRNHCVPVYEVLHSPIQEGAVFVGMPYLRLYNEPRLYTYGEAVECFYQLFEVSCLPLVDLCLDR